MILVGWETSPDDIHGMIWSKGVLTAHGGMTSHAAVVARGMGKPCVAGCEELSIDADTKTVRIGSHELREGDTITIDGGSGNVILGEVSLVPPQINEDFETILGWADDVRRLKVRANADNAEDSAKAREFGAAGDRALPHRAHVLRRGAAAGDAGDDPRPDEEGRRSALDRLLPFQQSDFEAIFEVMSGLPVTIRLLDPPLHEFLPPIEDATDERHAPADPPAARGEPDARYARLPARYPVAGDLRDAGARHRTRGAGRPGAHGRGAARRDHAPARRLRRGAAPAARAHDRGHAGGGAGDRVPVRHDDRVAARGAARRRDRRARRLLLVRHERPHADDARHVARRRRRQVPHRSTSRKAYSSRIRSRRSTRAASEI